MRKARQILRTFGLRTLVARGLSKAGRMLSGRSAGRLPSSTAAAVPGTRRQQAILVIDDYVPFFDRGAGAKRMYEILKLMRELDKHVIFISDEGMAHEPYTRKLREIGVDVLSPSGLSAAVAAVDVAWLSRPHICAKYLPRIRAAAAIPVIYDTVDLHYRRLASGETVTSREGGWQRQRDIELALAQSCDRTIVTTAEEEQLLWVQGIATTRIIPIIEPLHEKTPIGFNKRKGLLFVGNYTHEPNADAAVWFCTQIMPALRSRLPGIHLTLAGAEPTAAVRVLAGEDVSVCGFRRDLTPLFATHRVFVAPLRYGAGMKGKIIEALGWGLPTITTAVGAEGIALEHGHNVLLGESAAELEAAIVRLYQDPILWLKLSENGMRVAGRFAPDKVRPMVQQALDFSQPT